VLHQRQLQAVVAVALSHPADPQLSLTDSQRDLVKGHVKAVTNTSANLKAPLSKITSNAQVITKHPQVLVMHRVV
jgi:hypothetical protein